MALALNVLLSLGAATAIALGLSVIHGVSIKISNAITEFDRSEMVGGNLPLVSNNPSSIFAIWRRDDQVERDSVSFMARFSFSHHGVFDGTCVCAHSPSHLAWALRRPS